MRKVVITGMGAITPIGHSVAAYSQALFNGQSGAAPITRFDAQRYKTRFGCEVKNFDVLQFMDRAVTR